MRACRGRPVSGRGTLRQKHRRGRKAGGSPPLPTRAALPAEGGHRPAWMPRPLAEAEASERMRASSTRSPAVTAAGGTAGEDGQPRAKAAPAASAAGSGRSGGGGSDGAWKERGHRVSRATRSGARVSVAARQRRVDGARKVGRTGGRRRHGGKRGQWGAKAKAAQWGLEEDGRKGEGHARRGTIAGSISSSYPGSATIFLRANFHPADWFAAACSGGNLPGRNPSSTQDTYLYHDGLLHT